MAKKEKDIFYIQVRDSKHLRRMILEASKEIIVVLQRYEMFRRLRDAKLKLMENLSFQFKEIHELTCSMKIDVPKANFKSTKNTSTKTFPKKKDTYDSDPELQKLESAIADIERKLHDM